MGFKSTNTVILGPDLSGTIVKVAFTGSAGTTQAIVKGGRYRMWASQPCFVKIGLTTPVAPVDETDCIPVTEEAAEYILATGSYVNAIGRGVTSGYVQFVPLDVEP